MTLETRQRLFGMHKIRGDPFVASLLIAVVVLLALTPVVIRVLTRAGKASPALRKDLWERWLSWLVLARLMIVPVLFGAAWPIAAVGVLSLLCYREFARATGLFRERLISLAVAIGILMVTFSSLDNWYALFTALCPLVVGVIAGVGILPDQPSGYIQRVGLGVLGFMLFGACLGHLGFFGNDPNYRKIIFWLLLCVELNDVFAYVCGKSFGKRKLAPRTSPNKTVGGALGALVLTAILAASLGSAVFRGTILDQWHHLLTMGIIISALGQIGDLLVSSVKRDVGIKDVASTFPGHGGVLDRFNSLLLVSPAIFHYIDTTWTSVCRNSRESSAMRGDRVSSEGRVMQSWKLQPARDIELPLAQRVRSPRRECGLIEAIAHLIWWSLVRVYLKGFHRLSIQGRELMPTSGSFLVAANHASHLDALVLASAVPWRLRARVFSLAAGDTFFSSPLTGFLAAFVLNALPVWRRKAGSHALADLRDRLSQEESVYIVFPEGTRSRDGTMAPFKPGVGMLVAATDVPIVPCHLTGTFEAFGPDRRWPRPRKISLKISKQISFAGFANDREGWDSIAKAIEIAVMQLGSEA